MNSHTTIPQSIALTITPWGHPPPVGVNCPWKPLSSANVFPDYVYKCVCVCVYLLVQLKKVNISFVNILLKKTIKSETHVENIYVK